MRGGGDVDFPPLNTAQFLANCAGRVGWFSPGNSGPVKISALELQAWASGTQTDLGPNDFQDILDASSAFVAAFSDYDEKHAPPPWSPELTEEQELEIAAQQERAMDRAMGIS